MNITEISADHKTNYNISSEDSIPIYTFEETIPQPQYKARTRMMRAQESLSHFRIMGRQTLGEVSFTAAGIQTSANVKMGESKHCYLSALGYWVVSRQKWDLEIHPGYFNTEIQIPKVNPKKKYTLELDHREFKAFDVRNTRIDILVNGKTVASAHSPKSLEFVKENFDIGKHLVNGANTITISFSKQGETIYAIRSLKILEN
ncbi:MAG: hypothetical protein JSS32_03660 [Verrucomicrobia bacterium]|nr:hypothetical protein [Verrucomicrobiota bacterium]